MTTSSLAPRQHQAALLLAQGASKTEASRAVGVTRKTIYDWLKHPEFRAEVDRLAAEHLEAVKARVGKKSMEVLEEALDARDIVPTRFSDRLAAARTGLQVAGLTGTRGTTVQIGRAAVLFYGAPPGQAGRDVEYVPITEEELRAADRDLEAVEGELVGDDPGSPPWPEAPALPGPSSAQEENQGR
jgi:transposase